jgi:hypothetical protein
MALLDSALNREKRGNNSTTRIFKVAAGAKIHEGSLVGILLTGANAGYAVAVNPAVATAVKVVGISRGVITRPGTSPNGVADNTAGANGAISVAVEDGEFKLSSASANPVTQAHVGRVVYGASDWEVNVAPNTHAVGTVTEVEADGVWVLVGVPYAALVPVPV